MADISYTVRATNKKDAVDAVPGKGDANTLRVLACRTIELAAQSSGATIFFGRIPSNARLSIFPSRVYWDDLATSGSPTLDIGLASVNANITSDPNALSEGHDVTSADATGEPVIDDVSKIGKYAWEFVNGQTTDPGGQLDIYGSIVDAATTQTATVSIEVYGYTD